MHQARGSLRRLLVALLAVTALGGLSAFAVAAQDNTPTPAPGAPVVVPHPAHIHAGTCAQMDPNSQYPLKDIQPRMKDNKLPTSQDMKGSLTAIQVEVSETTVSAKLQDDLLKTAHTITIDESAQNIAHYIACGEIGGPYLDNKIIMGLQEMNHSGFSGVAILEADGDNTKVTVYLAKGLTPEAATTPAPTATAAPAGNATGATATGTPTP